MSRGRSGNRQIRRRYRTIQFSHVLNTFGLGLTIACVLLVMISIVLEARAYLLR